MPRLYAALSALSLIGTLACIPAEAAPRAFVASDGSDANTATNCGLAKPCRLFAAALTVVDPGGEVIALDGAGYGAVTITKSVTLTANPGYYAGVSASLGNAVTIATPGVTVILRGLSIKGQGALNGIHMTEGRRLSIENCVISSFSNPWQDGVGAGTGVNIETAANVQIVDSMIRDNSVGLHLAGGSRSTISGTKAVGNGLGVWVVSVLDVVTTAAISDSVVSANTGSGIMVSAGYGATARASVTRSTVANNYAGIFVDIIPNSTPQVTISNNLVTGNTLCGLCGPFDVDFPATLRSLGNNTVDQNGTNVIGTITPLSGL